MAFTPRCPACRSPIDWDDNPYRPFCSERCQLSDLGAWVMEQYRVPGGSVEREPPDDDSDENGST
jgi:uncharacterized protein